MHLTHQSDSKSITTKDRRDKATNEGVSLPSRTIVHAKLEMTSPQDAEELEADAVANEIVSGGKIRRKISQGGSGSSGISVSSQMESQLSRLQGGGQQMPTGLLKMMENGFGRDLSQVRLHTDSNAASMSSSIQAKAFTLGNDIYFNQGQYSPETTEGQKLVAHEVTHVVQESGKLYRKDESIPNTQTDSNIQELCIDGTWSKSYYYNEQINKARIIAKDMLVNAINILTKAKTIIQSLKAGINVNNQFSDLSIDIENGIKELKKKLKNGAKDEEAYKFCDDFYKNAAKKINDLFFKLDPNKEPNKEYEDFEISGILFLLEYCFGFGQKPINHISNSLIFTLNDISNPFVKIEELIIWLKEQFEKEKNHYEKYNTIIDEILNGYKKLNDNIGKVDIVVANPINKHNAVGWACEKTTSVTTVNGYKFDNTIFLQVSFVDNNKQNLGEISSTIIHELSHVFLKTLDIWYFGNIGKDGKDSGQSTDLTKNADSFSVFANYLYSSGIRLFTGKNGEEVYVKPANHLPRFDTFTDSKYKATSMESE